MAGAPNWSLERDEASRLDSALRALLVDAEALHVLLVDRAGQLVARASTAADLDATTFASLAAADFAANEQVASLLGDGDFSSLSHQGHGRSVMLADVAGRAILAVVFDERVTLGLVRIRARRALPAIRALVAEALSRTGGASRALPDLGTGWADEAEVEIDRLFGIR